MIRNENKYYTEVLKALKVKQPKFIGGQKYKATPPSFPYMYFHSIDNTTAARTLSNTEVAVWLSIEIQIYTNTTLDDAKTFMDIANDTMIGLGFERNYYEPVENTSDTEINRVIARFRVLDT